MQSVVTRQRCLGTFQTAPYVSLVVERRLGISIERRAGGLAGDLTSLTDRYPFRDLAIFSQDIIANNDGCLARKTGAGAQRRLRSHG